MQHADIALCKIKNDLQSAVGLIVLIMAYHGSEDRSFLKHGSLLHQTPPPPPPPCFWSVFFFSFFHRQKLRKREKKKLCQWETRKRKDSVSPPLSAHLCFSRSFSSSLKGSVSVTMMGRCVCVCVCVWVHARAWVGECVVGGGGGTGRIPELRLMPLPQESCSNSSQQL